MHGVKLKIIGAHMTIKRIFGIIILLFVIIATSANAADLCREKADSALKNLKTWQDLRLWHENYLACDDGYFAEGISDFVVRTLAKKWESLSALQSEIAKNTKFKDFVIKHIDATTDENQLEMVIENAKLKCPSKLQNLCNEIRNNAQTSLKEIKETTK